MKKIIKIISLILIVVLSTSCVKNIQKISYTDFNQYFSKDNKYTILDKTYQYGINTRRYIEAGNGNIQVLYIEFDSSKKAENYVKDNYSKNYKVKKYKKYTYVKSNKGTYLRLYRVNNIIVLGRTNNKKYKRELKKVLKDLGY